MNVAGQVQVEVLHWDDLGIATTRCTTLDAEGWALRRLADAKHYFLAKHAQALGQSDGRGRLALSQRRGSNGRHIDILALRPVGELLAYVKVDLSLVLAE